MGVVHESGADKVLESKAKGFGFNLNKFRLTARHCFTKSLPIVLTVLSSAERFRKQDICDYFDQYFDCD